MDYLQAGQKNRTGERLIKFLMPAFSQQAMKGYHEMMLDIATQLVQNGKEQAAMKKLK